jgi:uncharacterized protein YlxW (UPF0749 family)
MFYTLSYTLFYIFMWTINSRLGHVARGWAPVVLGTATGWLLGSQVQTSRTAKKLRAECVKEQERLYSQYYQDVYQLMEQSRELQKLVDELRARAG